MGIVVSAVASGLVQNIHKDFVVEEEKKSVHSREEKYSGHYLFSKSISHCCMYYVQKMYNKPKVNYQNTEKTTVLARMCKKIFRAGRRATRVQISPPFTVFTLALSCIHPVFTPCLHCILASVVLILYSHCSMLYLLLYLQLMYTTPQCSH